VGREKSNDEEAETLDLNLVAQTAAVPSALARISDPAEGVGGPLAFGAASLLIVVLAAQGRTWENDTNVERRGRTCLLCRQE
jgi:hypothetical protein